MYETCGRLVCNISVQRKNYDKSTNIFFPQMIHAFCVRCLSDFLFLFPLTFLTEVKIYCS